MSSRPCPEHWQDSAAWLVQAIDPRARLARFVAMDEAAYREASFLDDRMLQQQRESRICPLDEMLEGARALERDDARWIFHIGHVGSTLVSRLLGEVEGVLAVREPRALRDLGFARVPEQIDWAPALRKAMARTFSPGQAALVKATSFVSEWAQWLVADGGKALFLFATPRNYVAGILAGENSVKELAALSDIRADRLLRHRGIELEGFDRSLAHRAAAAWACEMTSLEEAASARPGAAISWEDFDLMLADMPAALGRCAAHFGFDATRDLLGSLANGPLMTRYSKALEYDYSPSLRADLLAEAEEQHRADIDAAIDALHRAAASQPLLARALERSEREP
jgi:hypothetical protein